MKHTSGKQRQTSSVLASTQSLPWMRTAQELRKGNRAQPIPSGKQYKRKTKYRSDDDA